ncbi:ABC transporter permease [Paramicrobacterium agarici]|uniref:Peptide/nickel transport system permease protein n=1 Tax=Paramicrobacterium agarici TaxID=630514 RepID=A0A2A9DUB2_9MICO|nr:ABC transporter permease [Microbacterium agarici]PFG30174.1 peptide/nickel transport system permease protein [Microbacterium agarici]
MTVVQLPQSPTETRRRQHPYGLYAALAVTAFFVVALVAPQALATHDPFALALHDALQPPSLTHWFGTDEQGRDLYSRVVFGARESLLIGAGATAVSMTLALILGAAASLGGRVVGAVAARVIEIQFAFPTLLLALLLVAIAGPSAMSQVFAVAIGTAPGYARMVRAQILAAKTGGYVEAATALGHSRGRILARHIIPNAVRPLVAVIAMSVGQSIVWASSLSFLGLGVAPPSPEWGALLEAGRLYITHAPWLTVMPGLVIVVIAITATTIGQHVQRALERGEK